MVGFGPGQDKLAMPITTIMGRIIISPVSTINYYFNTDYYQWMAQHETELKNIHNMNWWRAQKNEQERNMPRHANRSPNWIPSRIINIRDKLIETQLSYLFGDKDWNEKPFSNDLNCRHCNVYMEDISEYISKVTDSLDDIWNWHNDDKKDFEPSLQQVLDFYDDKYPELVKEKARLNLPTYGSRTMVGHINGFCHVCWEDIIKPQLGWDNRLV